jgi:hypothetical protein
MFIEPKGKVFVTCKYQILYLTSLLFHITI